MKIKQNTYDVVAEEILEAIGGRGNVISASHCATRLRLVLQDDKRVNTKVLEEIDLVKGQFLSGGQFQVIIGAGTVDEVYREFIQLAGIETSNKNDVKKDADQKMNRFQRLIKLLSDIFVPVIPALVAAGLLMGINNVLTSQGLFISGKSLIDLYPGIEDLASMINLFANAAFVFLPILIGFSATRIFGGNPYLGAVIGMIMVHPDLLNAYGYGQAVIDQTVPTWNIFGFEIEKVGYQGTVLPVLASSFVLAFTEKRIRRVMPSALDNLLTPLLSVFITAVLTFVLVGGVMRSAGNVLAESLVWMYDTLGFVGGAIFGLFLAPLTLTGMHHSLLPVDIQLIAGGGSFLLALVACNNVAQGGATFAAMLTTRDSKLKSIGVSSGLSALLGITEPAMFGVNLRLKYPFYAAMLGSAVGGAYAAFTKILNVAPGPAGITGFVTMKSGSIIDFLIAVLLSVIVSFILTLVFAKSKRFNRVDQ